MSMSCFDCHDYMDGYNRGKKEGTIEEFEKLKVEIKEKYNRTMSGYRGGLSDAIFIIDKRIAELKGENK